MRARLPSVIVMLTLLLLAGTVPSAAGGQRSTPPDHRVAIGVAKPDGRNIGDLDRFSASIDRRPAIWTIWSQWGLRSTRDFPMHMARQLSARGVTPMIWWEPVDPTDLRSGKYSRYRNIVSGDHDGYIRRFARDAKAFGHTVLLRFAHEPNGKHFPWSISRFDNSPRNYVAAWRRVYRIFQRQGATNVRFVWSVNKKRCPGGCNPFRAIFPGDAYVDIVGMSNHNWGATKDKWVPMFKGVRRTARQLRSITRKPMMIAELGSSDRPGNKAAWVRRGYRMVYKRLPYIKAIVYLDADLRSIGHPDWSITRHGGVISAFGEIASMKRYQVRDPFGDRRGR